MDTYEEYLFNYKRMWWDSITNWLTDFDSCDDLSEIKI